MGLKSLINSSILYRTESVWMGFEPTNCPVRAITDHQSVAVDRTVPPHQFLLQLPNINNFFNMPKLTKSDV